MKKYRSVMLLIVMLCFSHTVLSTNGVVEINHICATQLGCFSGDSIGYPITIDGTAGKSYRLTSDLIVPDENTNGIDIESSNISIDLNGFSIVRSGCENNIDCVAVTSNQNGSGIFATNNNVGLSVKNGSIIGMGLGGVLNFSSGGNFEKLQLRFNRAGGNIGRNSIISDSIIADNSAIGLLLGDGSVARNNTVSDNGDDGILASKSVLIVENTVYGNRSDGIISGEGGIVKDNNVYENVSIGIICNSSMVSNNSIYENGFNGLSLADGCNVQENSIQNNTGYGIAIIPLSTLKVNVLESNKIINNMLGTINGSNYFILKKNFCETDDVCP